MRAWFLGILLVIVGLTLAIGLWLLGYHLSGKWAFNRWKAERVAMGDRLDWKDLVPAPVPVNQNFAEAPLIRGAIREKGKVDPRFKALEVPKAVNEAMGNWQEGRRDDLEAISRAYGTRDLQTVFKPMAATLKELEEASLRPASRLPIDYQELEIPALLGFRSAARTLRIRALSCLKNGNADQALKDVQTCFRIGKHLKHEPTLLCLLLKTAITGIAMQVVWEGVEDHRWNISQLQEIQQDLQGADLLEASVLAWQGERQHVITSFSAVAENQPAPKFTLVEGVKGVRLGALGRGWFFRNLLVISQYESSWVDAQDPVAHRVFPNKIIDPSSWLKEMRFRKDLVMAQIALPALFGQIERIARLQALVDEGLIACALERHRLDKGQYPDRLEALSPAYLQTLPHDLVTGGPLHYSRRGDTFALYQVGWDGKDDGGTVAWVGEGKERKLDPTKGDWVWPHASQ
jgi:hypothetical protein